MKQIRLTKGLYALVNDEDFDWLNQWSWCASLESRGTKWYAIRREKGVKIRMHVEIVKRRGIKIPPGHVVDHVNHNSLDNRFEYYVREHGALNYYQGVTRLVQQLEVITQTENMRRSPGFKQKGKRYGKSNSIERETGLGQDDAPKKPRQSFSNQRSL